MCKSATIYVLTVHSQAVGDDKVKCGESKAFTDKAIAVITGERDARTAAKAYVMGESVWRVKHKFATDLLTEAEIVEKLVEAKADNGYSFDDWGVTSHVVAIQLNNHGE